MNPPQPAVEVVIALHDLRRPIRRAVASVANGGAEGTVRALVIAHGLPVTEVERQLEGLDAALWRVVRFTDGISSPAGPFNHGLAIATAPWVMVMGSDDYLEPGAIEWMLRRAREDESSVVIVPERHQAGGRIEAPLVRAGRTSRLNVAKDRMFYRTAPLALIRRELVESIPLRFDAAYSTGEDLDFSTRLWTSGLRVSYHRLDPAYVVGADATVRVTTTPRLLTISLAPVLALVNGDYARGLPADVRRALAVKVIRIHVLGALGSRAATTEPLHAAERGVVTDVLTACLSLAPRALAPFSASDQALLDDLMAHSVDVNSAVARAQTATRWRRLVPRNPLRTLDRESTLRRYISYSLLGSRKDNARWSRNAS